MTGKKTAIYLKGGKKVVTDDPAWSILDSIRWANPTSLVIFVYEIGVDGRRPIKRAIRLDDIVGVVDIAETTGGKGERIKDYLDNIESSLMKLLGGLDYRYANGFASAVNRVKKGVLMILDGEDGECQS